MIVALLAALMSLPAQTPSLRDSGCHEWRECRALALAAAERREYETFHDLAWRAVQTGPPRDPALMYLLARAQALSGRPHDALVMLDRLAEMGVASDADTNDDFVRTRQLAGWPELAARMQRLRPAAAPSAPTALAAPPAPPPVAAPPLPPVATAPPPPAPAPPAAPMPTPRGEALRFSAGRLTAVGLAYDAVSRRIVL